jgi:alpha-tubulin suppressor-like RCC1 family protein
MRYIHLSALSTAGLTIIFCLCMVQSAFAGSIIGWGSNDYGEATPPDGNDFVAIAAGVGNSLALKSDGSIVAWGNNGRGQITPPDGNDFVAIAAGTGHSLALKSDGSIVAWGDNRRGLYLLMVTTL